MPFIPHTEEETRAMLAAIGVARSADLFDEIPPALRAAASLEQVPPGIGEMEMMRLARQRAARDGRPLCFAGGGAYDHHIPAAVWQIAARGEFYSAYTPYQAEASQGTLQLLYEYQSMMAGLMAMEVSNASLYDGASALGEAALMAVRAQSRAGASTRGRRILLPRTLHPVYRKVTQTLVRGQGIGLVELDYDPARGALDPAALDLPAGVAAEECAALIIPQPNYFGALEEVDALVDWAHARGMLAIGVVNPLAMALLKPPGEWGERGADIVCGEAQPLGMPLSSGGPYCGFLCCRNALMRQLPGRLAGRTVDRDGKPGFTLTLQAREQHIRRSRATSNICTNQGLLVTAAAIHMSLMGAEGLERVAAACHANTGRLVERLTAIPGVEALFDAPRFHEAVVRLPIPAAQALEALAAHDIVGGIALDDDYPELGNALLVCATELRTDEEIEQFAGRLEQILA